MARIFLDEMGGVNQGMFGAYGLPVSPFSTEDYVAPVTETQSRPARTRRKQNKPKPKRNDGIIRNHDSVWDYKIQDGKLLTRRKTSDGKWYDITGNDEARTRLEQFTGKNITNADNRNNVTSTPITTSNQQQVAYEPKENSITNSKSNLASRFMPQPISQQNSYIQNFANIPQSRRNSILSGEDLAKNNWHWGGVDDITFEGVSNSLYADAVDRANKQGSVLLDKKGRPVTNNQVNHYLWLMNHESPDKTSAYDAQFYQPQSEQVPRYIRQAQDSRRNREFDRQRNAALATMFGLPLAGIGAAEAIAAGPVLAGAGYLGADVGGKLVNAATKRIYGRTWDEMSDDPNVNFYAELLNPGRWIGGAAGGYAGAKLQRRMIPIQQYPSGEYEFYGDRIGKVVPKQSAQHNRQTVNMLYDPTTNEPVLNGIAPRYTVEIPNNVISVGPEPLWYDTRFMNVMRDMKSATKTTKPKKRSIKTTKAKTKTK